MSTGRKKVSERKGRAEYIETRLNQVKKKENEVSEDEENKKK